MIINEHLSIVDDGEKKLIINNDNGIIIQLTNDCAELVFEFVNSDKPIDEYVMKFNDIKFADFFIDLINRLSELKILLAKREEKKILIYWDITDECNLSCIHCCADAKCKKDKEDNKNYGNIIDKIAEIKNVDVVISGGEPLMCSNFREITEYLRDKVDGELSLMTNATLIDDELAELISRKYNSISVSIDGYDEETTSFIRGKNVFEKTIKGIEQLKKYNAQNISASMLITQKTVNSKHKFSDLCNKYGMKEMTRGLTRGGRAKYNLERLEIPDDWKNFKKENIEKEKANIRINKQYKNGLCQATFSQFQIDKDGNIYPCQLLKFEEFKLGNLLFIDNVYDFIRNRLFDKTPAYINFCNLLPNSLEGCSDCKYTEFCHICPAEEYLKEGKYIRKDCELAKEIFQEYFN